VDDVFDGRLTPITETFGFLQCETTRAAKFFVDWDNRIHADRGLSVVQRTIEGGVEAVMRSLLPLTSVQCRRYLFIPTRSNWTAYLDNGHQGTDAFPPMSYMAGELKCNGVRATCGPKATKKSLPGIILEMYGPERTEWLNVIRTVSAASDGSRWSFHAWGPVQPFEDTEKYLLKRKRDRFTAQMMKQYLEALGICMFDPDFYLPEGTNAILVEKVGPIAADAQEFSLEDVQ
jgi:hypothetical protein